MQKILQLIVYEVVERYGHYIMQNFLLKIANVYIYALATAGLNVGHCVKLTFYVWQNF